MIGVLRSVVEERQEEERASLVREYVQQRVLANFAKVGAMPVVSFHGGTCLRMAHNLSRYSEDLDFSLDGEPSRYDLQAWAKKTAARLEREGHDVQIKSKRPVSVVDKVEICFPGLLYQTGASPMQDQNLRIKIEVDTRPPEGNRSVKVPLHHEVAMGGQKFQMWCHDLPSMMSGKIGAVLTREYTKGRDHYDFRWYLQKRPAVRPNLIVLNNSLRQSMGTKAPELTEENWRQHVADKLRTIDWQTANADADRFLMEQNQAGTLSAGSLLADLESHEVECESDTGLSKRR